MVGIMKRLFMLTLLAGFMFCVGQLLAEAGAQAAGAAEQAPVPTSADLLQPAFSLEDLPQDSPAMSKKKAALRLFKAYGVTLGQMAACRGQVPEAEKALGSFTRRNGNTLATVMGVIKQYGGLSPDVKNVVDAAVAAEVSALGDCRVLVKAVAKGQRDIYKAPQYQGDYKLIRSK